MLTYLLTYLQMGNGNWASFGLLFASVWRHDFRTICLWPVSSAPPCVGLAISCVIVVVAAGKWDEMEVYADMIPKDTYDSSFFRAIINIHANEFQKAQQVWFCRLSFPCYLRPQLINMEYNWYWKTVVAWPCWPIRCLFTNTAELSRE